MSNIRIFPVPTAEPQNPIAMLEAAKNGDLETVAIVGRGANGELFLSSNLSNPAEIGWLFELAKKEIMEHC